MDYTDREDLRQMLADIVNRQKRVHKRDMPFLSTTIQKFREGVDLSYEESERLVHIWDKVTEEG